MSSASKCSGVNRWRSLLQMRTCGSLQRMIFPHLYLTRCKFWGGIWNFFFLGGGTFPPDVPRINTDAVLIGRGAVRVADMQMLVLL